MRFAVEFSDAGTRDIDLIFDHLVETYAGFGDDVFPGIRSIAIDRATYWFKIDQESRRIVVQAVFFGGQDDVRHMLARLLRDAAQSK